ncbi:hypothetical protein EMCRGX_G015111 [Ephydatia muelleri]
MGLAVVAIILLCFHEVAAEACSPEGSERIINWLVPGYPPAAAGIVEVCLNGVWGTVCTDSPNTLWSEKNALMICTDLSFSGALNSVDQSTLPPYYTVNLTTPINYKAVRCDGTEESLSLCSHSETTTGCTHASDAAVVCRQSVSDGDVRLVGSTTNGQGAVEMYSGEAQSWFSVCPTGWTSNDASVVCQLLGYQTGVSVIYRLSNGLIPKAPAYCISEPPSCHVLAYDKCNDNSTNYAGVICTSADASSGAVRLSGGSRPSVGRVEVLYNGVWGTVCTYGSPWTLIEGQVVCTQLGYKNLSAVSISPKGSISDVSLLYPIWLSGVTCSSQNTNITQCNYTKPIGFNQNCFGIGAHLTDAKVDCQSPTPDPPPSPSPDPPPSPSLPISIGTSSIRFGALGAVGGVVILAAPVAGGVKYRRSIGRFVARCWLQFWLNVQLLLCCCFLAPLANSISHEHIIQNNDDAVQVVTPSMGIGPSNHGIASSEPSAPLYSPPPQYYPPPQCSAAPSQYSAPPNYNTFPQLYS